MLKFDFQNCHLDDLKNFQSELSKAMDQLRLWQKSQDAIFFDYPFEKNLTKTLKEAAKFYDDRFENLVVLGIGGSALGMSFLAGALLDPHYNVFGKKKLFVCDNVDPDSFDALLKQIDIKKTLFNVISKSGGTIETASQFFLAGEILKDKLGDSWKENIVATTDPQNGVLREYVNENSINSFDLPSKLGGRFSVLSSVGLFPAILMGIDIDGLIAGASNARSYCEKNSIEENHALHIAAISYMMDVKLSKKISVMIPYADSLKLFADWYAQLWGESLGKAGKGTTPVKALGATDQHSQLQLYMEGPNDKLITFVGVEKFRNVGKKIKPLMNGFDFIDGKTLSDLIHAEQKATSQALAKAGRPNLTVTLPSLDAKHIGELIFVYETATVLAGALYGINPFDQPGVELGKKLTKEILK